MNEIIMTVHTNGRQRKTKVLCADDKALSVIKHINRTRSLIFADDEADLRESFRYMCDDEGISVSTAENGVRALRFLYSSESEYTVILTDIDMPVMNGIEFITELKETASTVPIIALSADSDSLDIAMRAGADFGISKPYNLASVIRLIQNL